MWLIATGGAAAALLGFGLLRLMSIINDLKSELDAELAGNPFRGLADVAVQAVQVEWGWAVLFFGAIALITAGTLHQLHVSQ